MGRGAWAWGVGNFLPLLHNQEFVGSVSHDPIVTHAMPLHMRAQIRGTRILAATARDTVTAEGEEQLQIVG